MKFSLILFSLATLAAAAGGTSTVAGTTSAATIASTTSAASTSTPTITSTPQHSTTEPGTVASTTTAATTTAATATAATTTAATTTAATTTVGTASPTVTSTTATATTMMATTATPTASNAPTDSPTPWTCELSTILECYTDFASHLASVSTAAEMCAAAPSFGECMGSCLGSKLTHGSSGGGEILAPLCGADANGDTTVYDLFVAEPSCDRFLNALCAKHEITISMSILASVASADLAAYLDESNDLSVQLRSATCEAVIEELNDALDSSSSTPSLMVSDSVEEPQAVFSCEATIEAVGGGGSRLRRLSESSQLKITTNVQSSESFSPEEAADIQSDISAAEDDIGKALIDSAGALVTVDQNQSVSFEVVSDSPEASAPPSGSDDDDSLSTAVIAGIAVGAIAGVALVLAGVVYTLKHKSGTLKPEEEDSMKPPQKNDEE